MLFKSICNNILLNELKGVHMKLYTKKDIEDIFKISRATVVPMV